VRVVAAHGQTGAGDAAGGRDLERLVFGVGHHRGDEQPGHQAGERADDEPEHGTETHKETPY